MLVDDEVIYCAAFLGAQSAVGFWAEGTCFFVQLVEDELVFVYAVEAHFGFGLGREIFIPSVFVGRVGERQNIPVVRIATIAAMPVEPVRGGSPRRPAYLIETKSLDGTSGAPAMFHTSPNQAFGRVPISIDPHTGHRITPYYLIGIVVGAHSGQYSSDFAHDADEAEKVVPKDADFNAGIAVVVPVSQILEVLNCDKLKTARDAAVQASKNASGFRQTHK